FLKVIHPVVGINECAIVVAIERHGHSVNGKVTAFQVVFQRTIFYHRLARIAAVRLLPRPDELHLQVLIPDLRRSEIAEIVHLCSRTQGSSHLFRQGDTAAHTDKVDVFERTAQHQLTHTTPNNIRPNARCRRSLRNNTKNFLIQMRCEVQPPNLGIIAELRSLYYTLQLFNPSTLQPFNLSLSSTLRNVG